MKRILTLIVIAGMVCCMPSCINEQDYYYEAEYDFEYEDTAVTTDNQEDTQKVNTNWYSGKKLLWIGDSIVYGLTPPDGSTDRKDRISFANMTATALDMSIINDGISGSSIAKSISNTEPMSERYINLDSDCDVIVVSGGTNDFDRNVELGSIHDTTNDTFYGAVKILCEGLLSKYPDRLIVFTTPIKRADIEYPNAESTNLLGKTLKDYADVISEVCSIYSIPVIDLRTESGLEPELPEQSKNFSDGIHLTRKGHEIVSLCTIEFFKQLDIE